MEYFLIGLVAFAIMYVLTPLLRKLAFRVNYVEPVLPDQRRKIHAEPKPYLASLGMFLSFWVPYAIFVRQFNKNILLLFIASLLVFAIGTIDDWFKTKGRDLSVLPKMSVQLLACIMAYKADIVITGFTNPINGSYVTLPVLVQFIVTLIWLFGVITVINFTDGLDGLAGGISCIAASTLFVVAVAKGQQIPAQMAVLLVGICLGYLRYNKFPAKILMGDAGATFLGFMLGVISLYGMFKQATFVSIVVPILALGLPIFDNIFVVFKRIKNGKPIYIGDTSQIHFRLLAKGLTHKQVVYFLYLVSICLNLCAIVILLLYY